MRRYACIFAVMIIVVLSFAKAEEAPTILFRGNEWGASFDDVKSSFPVEIQWYSLEPDSSFSVLDHMLGNHKRYYDGHVCCYTSAASYSLKDFEVAGYDISYVQLRFAYVPDENGLIVEDAEHTALYYAKYRIDCRNTLTVFKDLKSKLDTLYGDISVKSWPEYSFTETYLTWYAEDGTMVSLMQSFGRSNPFIEIMYGFSGGDDLLDAARDALAYGESLISPTNYNGL